jgi:hypothetical protein
MPSLVLFVSSVDFFGAGVTHKVRCDAEDAAGIAAAICIKAGLESDSFDIDYFDEGLVDFCSLADDQDFYDLSHISGAVKLRLRKRQPNQTEQTLERKDTSALTGPRVCYVSVRILTLSEINMTANTFRVVRIGLFPYSMALSYIGSSCRKC